MNHSRFNRPLILVLALALLLPAMAAAQGGNGGGGGNNRNNGLLPMPVLIITMGGDQAVGNNGGAGGELSGGFASLIVYSNGLVLWSSNDDGTGAGADCNIQAQSISQDQLSELQRNLRRAGGFRAGSNVQGGAGGANQGQLITVTVLRDAGNSSNSIANTFSFFADDASGASLRVFNVLNTFFTGLGIDFDNDGNGNGSGTGS